MKSRWLLWLGVGVVVLVGAALLDPTCVVLGFLRGESFYRSRPATYWGRALKNEDPIAHVETTKTLKEGGASAVPVLIELLREDRKRDWASSGVRWMAADLLGQIGVDARNGVPALVGVLKDEDTQVRAVAARSLMAIAPEGKEMVPVYTELLHSDERERATRELSRFGAEATPAVPALRELLKDRSADVRWNAARTLGKIGPTAREAVPALVATLKDEDALVREHAAEALGDIGPDARAAVPDLIAVSSDPDARVRRDAARSLGQIGPAAKAAALRLKELLKDENERVRVAARKSLQQVEPEAATRE